MQSQVPHTFSGLPMVKSIRLTYARRQTVFMERAGKLPAGAGLGY